MPECPVRPLSIQADLCDMEQKGFFSIDVFYYLFIRHELIVTMITQIK